MRVTVITDASHCSETKAAGYGFWIVSQRGARAGGGPLQLLVADSTEAEMRAVLVALTVGVETKVIDAGDEVLVQVDNIPAMHHLQGIVRNAERRMPVKHAVGLQLRELAAGSALRLQWRHVKGHTNVQDSRSQAQRHSDRRAYAGMTAARDVIRAGGDLGRLQGAVEAFPVRNKFTRKPVQNVFRTELIGETKAKGKIVPLADGELPW